MKFGRNTAAAKPERARGSDWGHGLPANHAAGGSAAGSDKRRSPGSSAATAAHRSRTLRLPYGRRQSAVFQCCGASQRPTVAPAGYANARFAVAQNAQDSNRGVDTAGNLVNVG